MRHPAPDPRLALEYLVGHRSIEPLYHEARKLRDAGKGRTITYSRKAFIPITTLCRDRCTYCTFAKPPGAGGEYMTPEEVMAVAELGERYGCTEALLTLGDRPEARWREARSFLDRQECASTLEYVQRMSERIVAETSLFPHANPGVMDVDAIVALRPSSVSMGLMLENVSSRLMESGMPHFNSPDKDPAARIETMEAAGRARVPFTTGVLVGIGETPEEIVDSLFALAALHARHHNIQEIIVQNFRAKADTPMRCSAEPTPELTSRVAALARWIFGAEMNIQVPPNLTERFETYLEAGVNDWGGVSPVTIDWVNPEQPWPRLDELKDRTEAAGFRLRPRLPVYPEFIDAQWIDPALLVRTRAATDASGFALAGVTA
ncbi:MAG: 7,8-didemethyl-8-hydroxy-5-deazariboflavin synthase CofG [Gammaproteobacteria bacterium]|nr:7,8-didemethyl-8-hydroxy-5-deazariboflavin synthase CofG [Gammaproteobacteria bacterium]